MNFINFRNNKYFGFELGHSFFNREKNSFISTVNNNKYLILFRMLNSYLDAHSYWPLSSNFDLIAALGIGRIRTDIQLLGNGHLNVATLKLPATLIGTRNKLGIRIGFGLQYKWRSNFFTKLTYCRQTGNKITRTLNLLQLSGAIKI